MTQTELDEIVNLHERWFRGLPGGMRITLRGANLSRAALRYTYLNTADLRGANLSRADLRYTSLSKVDLRGADLREANLEGANLSNIRCAGADFSGANLGGGLAAVRRLRCIIRGYLKC
jgi:uncharacterized protein YjbI with pentapeptide repeats